MDERRRRRRHRVDRAAVGVEQDRARSRLPRPRLDRPGEHAQRGSRQRPRQVIGLGVEVLARQRSAGGRADRVTRRLAEAKAACPAQLQPEIALIAGRDARARNRAQGSEERAQRGRRPDELARDRRARLVRSSVQMEDRAEPRVGVRGPAQPGLERLARRAPRERREHVGGARRERVELERELRDNPDVATAAPLERPQQVGVGAAVDRAQLTARGHQLGTDELVGRQSERPTCQPHAAAERDAGDPDRGARARRDRGAAGGETGVHVDQLRAGADRRGSGAAVDRDLVEQAQVEHDPALECRVAGVAVTAAAGPNLDAVGDRPADRRLHIGRVQDSRHRLREDRVEPLVVDVCCGAEARRAGGEHMAADRLLERPRVWRHDRVPARARATTASARERRPSRRRLEQKRPPIHLTRHRS